MTVIVKGISLALDIDPNKVTELASLGMLVIVGTVVISCTYAVVFPDTLDQAVFKVVFNTVEFVLTVDTFVVRIKVIPFVVDVLPAAGENAADQVVVLTVESMESAAGDLFAAVEAGDLIADNTIVMAGRGNGSAPVNNRVTFVTVGSAGVAGLCTGRRLVRDRVSAVNMGRAV